MQDLQRHFGLEGFSGRLPIFPLPDLVFFPCTLLPLHVFEPRYRDMVKDATAGEGCIGMAMLKPGWEPAYYGNPPVHEVACLGKLIETTRLEDGRYNIVLCGVKRARIQAIESDRPYRTARVELLDDTPIDGREREAEEMRERLLRLAVEVPPALLRHKNLACALRKLEAPLGCSADLMSDSLVLPSPVKQRLLEELDPFRRAELLIRAVERETHSLVGASGRRTFPPQPSAN
jgi:Lon protease-like protein